MAKQKNNEIIPANQQQPSWLTETTEGKPQGLENMRGSDILIPRFKLMQALSPEVVDRKHQMGDIINSVTGDMLIELEQAVDIIPFFHYLQWIQWGERDSGEGIIESSLDPDGKLAQMAARKETRQTPGGKKKFVVTEYHNFVCLVPSISMKFPISLSCSKTSFKTGKKLLALATFRGKFPLYAGKYSLMAHLEKNKQGQQYYTFAVDNAGWVEEAQFKMAEELYELISEAHKQRRLETDQSNEVEADAETEM